MNRNAKTLLLAAMLGTSAAYLAYIAPSIYRERKADNSQSVQRAEQSDLEKKVDLPEIEPGAVSLKSFPGFEYADQYDELILKYTDFWNDEFEGFSGYEKLDANLVKSMVCQESGGHRDAFLHDPMQIANEGDFGLHVLRDGSESGIPADGYPELKGILETPRRNSRWDYSGSKMSPELSIKFGIRWLVHKARRFNSKGETIGFRPWTKALERYNGSEKKEEYAQSILRRLE